MQQINLRTQWDVGSAEIAFDHVPYALIELRGCLRLSGCRLGCATAVEHEVARADEGSAYQRCRTDGLVQRSASVAAPKRGRVALGAD